MTAAMNKLYKCPEIDEFQLVQVKTWLTKFANIRPSITYTMVSILKQNLNNVQCIPMAMSNFTI